MSLDSAAAIETPKQFPVVDIKYENIKQEESLLTVDGVKLGRVLSEVGYPSSVIRPIVIIDNIPQHPEAMAGYGIDGVLRISNSVLIRDTRRMFNNILTMIGEVPIKDSTKPDLLTKIIQSKIFRTLCPVFWPYNMLKDKSVPFLLGNPDRYLAYMKAAKEGNLMPEKPLKEQRERAKKHLSRMMELAMKSSTGWMMAHEYEHINKTGRKTATTMALGALPLVGGVAILEALDYMLVQNGQSLPPEASVIGITAMLGGVLLGAAKGRSLDEQASYDAGYKNFASVMECFNINHEVFQREVLGETQQIDTPT